MRRSLPIVLTIGILWLSACAAPAARPASSPAVEMVPAERCRETILAAQADTKRAWQADQAAEQRAATCRAMVDQDVARIDRGLATTQGDLERLRVQLSTRLKPLIATGAVRVQPRNGHLVVQLPASVLFDSGSATLHENGRRTLGEVSRALADLAAYDLVVAGHTDSMPIHTARFTDNWDLSTARAAEVVRFLVGRGLDPSHLLAAGVAQFDPVADDSTEIGREQNRRIEIVLLPRVQSLLGTDTVPTPPTPAPPSSSSDEPTP